MKKSSGNHNRLFGWISPEDIVAPVMVGAVLYAALRAVSLSVFHDEANSYFLSQRSWIDILTFHQLTPASHWLNTLLTKFLTGIFGPAEAVLRLPSLIGLVLYLTAFYRILRSFVDGSILVFGSCLFALHPMLLELFSAARGYGLALGFFGWGMAFFLEVVKAPSPGMSREYQMKTMGMLVLAVLSHLTLVYVFAAVFVVFLFMDTVLYPVFAKTGRGRLSGAETRPGQFLLVYILPAAVLMAVYVAPVFRWRENVALNLWYGGIHGFWPDTFLSLIKCSIYRPSLITAYKVYFIEAAVILILCWTAVHLLYQLFRRRTLGPLNRALLGVLSVLVLSVCGMTCGHVFLGLKYPVGRLAVYLIPLFFLMFVLLWASIRQWTRPLFAKAMHVALCAAALIYTVHFFRVANLTHYAMCRYDAHTKAVMQALEKSYRSGTDADGAPVSLGVNWMLAPAVKYYKAVNHMDWLEPIGKKPAEGEYDYYYFSLDPYEMQRWQTADDLRVFQDKRLNLIEYFSRIPAVLAFRKRPQPAVDNDQMDDAYMMRTTVHCPQ